LNKHIIPVRIDNVGRYNVRSVFRDVYGGIKCTCLGK